MDEHRGANRLMNYVLESSGVWHGKTCPLALSPSGNRDLSWMSLVFDAVVTAG